MVPEARFELAHREAMVFETTVSAIPPLGHRCKAYSIVFLGKDGKN